MKSRFYTAQEVAEMLGVHQSTASVWWKCGAFCSVWNRMPFSLRNVEKWDIMGVGFEEE